MSGVDPELGRLLAAGEADPDPRGAAAVARREAVLALCAAGRVTTTADRIAAARLLVHGDQAAEVEAAQALALAAMAGDRRARRLAATAFDRLRLLAGAPQKFGTQFVLREGRLQLWPVDPATTDSERAKWDVPPLAELRGGETPPAGP